MDYNTLRHFADSWGLVFLSIVFVVAVGMAFRPSARARSQDAALIPFREED